jgi:hypothetical protein
MKKKKSSPPRMRLAIRSGDSLASLQRPADRFRRKRQNEKKRRGAREHQSHAQTQRLAARDCM